LNSTNTNLYLVILYILTSVQILVFIIFLFCTYLMVRYKKKMDGTIQYILKLLSFYTLLMTNVLPLPFFNVFIFAFKCDQNIIAFQGMTCFSGLHILHMVFSAVDLMIWLFFTLLFIMFFSEYNPISDIPFAGPLSKIALYRFMVKVILIFYFYLDAEVKKKNYNGKDK